MGLMCKRWGIDTTHMSRSSPTKGKRSTKRKPAHERLVMGNPTDHRVKPYTLRCAMFDSGFDYKCNICGIDEWQGHKIGLEVDHKDEQYWNNTLENLQFLCIRLNSLVCSSMVEHATDNCVVGSSILPRPTKFNINNNILIVNCIISYNIFER